MAAFDLHSIGRTAVNPAGAEPKFYNRAFDDFRVFDLLAGQRFSSPTVDNGDPLTDQGVPPFYTNLVLNPGFEAGINGWTANLNAGTKSSSPTPFEGGSYFYAGNIQQGFAEQTINLLTAGFTAAQLDSQDFVVVCGGRVRSLSEQLRDQGAILKKKGRNALIGVVATHLGILLLIAGAIYGGAAGFRHQVKVIKGEMTVVPGLPFVIRLDELVVEEYPETFEHMNLEQLPRARQDSRLTLFRGGEPWRELVAAPGAPARVGGITLLPSIRDIGWYFELVVSGPGGETVVPVRPWAPPLLKAGGRVVMAHSLLEAGD